MGSLLIPLKPQKIEMEEAQKRNKHVVLVPFPLQGHMNPMLQLASILHHKGFSIIIAHTKLNAPDPSNLKDFILLSIEENLSDQDTSCMDMASLLSIVNSKFLVPFEKSLEDFIRQKPLCQVSCIIYDAFMYCAEDVASRLNLPNILLYTPSTSFVLAFLALLPHHENGGSVSQDSVTIKREFLSSSLGDFKKQLNLIEILSCKITKSAAGIWNSMEHLECHSLAQFQHQYQVPSFAIGPLHKIAPTISTSFLSEDIDCMRWLDSQAKNSVIYVSLGSLATMEPSELEEMAWGLANSEKPFLWVVRPGLVIGSKWNEHLPKSYKETVGERGCIVKWAPQKEVLAHDSVGGFWSHCGWNSTLESICEGVPMICRPAFADQWVNARYLNHDWKIGIELKDVLDRQKIEKAVRRLMQETEGEQMRQRAATLKEMTNLALAEGGTSYNSLNSLVDLILSF